MENFTKIGKIDSIEELLVIGEQKEHPVVYVTRWDRLSPVAFLRNWQAHRLNSWVQQGCFYRVEPKNEEVL